MQASNIAGLYIRTWQRLSLFVRGGRAAPTYVPGYPAEDSLEPLRCPATQISTYGLKCDVRGMVEARKQFLLSMSLFALPSACMVACMHRCSKQALQQCMNRMGGVRGVAHRQPEATDYIAYVVCTIIALSHDNPRGKVHSGCNLSECVPNQQFC